MIEVSVQIMTSHRPDGLVRAVRSVFGQNGIDPATVEILVVDNSSEASAQPAVTGMVAEAARAGYLLRYVHEPRRGVAQARNAGVRHAGADLIAYIDDDEEADAEWLCRMRACMDRYHADLVAGPVFPVFEAPLASLDAFWHRCYTVDLGLPSGASPGRGIGTGNSMFSRSRCCENDEPFDPSLDKTGGEDCRFFLAVKQRGGRIAWCADAVIREHVPVARTQLAYLLRRRLRQNQLTLQFYYWHRPPDWRSIFKWMGIGLAQALVFTPLSAAWWFIDRARAQSCLALAVGGIGKLIWHPRLTLIQYGAPAGRRRV